MGARQQRGTIDKSQRRIGAMFDRIAPTYDFLNHFLSLGMDLWWRRRALESLRLRPYQRLLDAATGTGDLAFTALELQRDLKITGADLAFGMLREATAKRDSRGVAPERLALLAGDVLRLPFSGSCFDAVMIAYGIRNVPDMDAALGEFFRVLRPGGQLLILEFSLPSAAALRSLYLFYFERILPLLGGWISRDPEAYGYLPASVGAFVTPEQMASRVARCGFRAEEVKRLCQGVTYYLRARKADK